MASCARPTTTRRIEEDVETEVVEVATIGRAVMVPTTTGDQTAETFSIVTAITVPTMTAEQHMETFPIARAITTRDEVVKIRTTRHSSR